MDKTDRTAIGGIVIGAGIAVASVAIPWEIPAAVRHILFWLGTIGAAGGAAVILDAHYLHARHKLLRYGVPAIMGVLFVVAIFAIYIRPEKGGVFARFRFTNPPEVWLNHSAQVEFTFSNQSSDDWTYGELAMTEVRTNSQLYHPFSALNICVDSNMRYWRMIDQFNPPGTAPIDGDIGFAIVSTHRSGGLSGPEAVRQNPIPKGKSAFISTSFSFRQVDWDKFNTVVLCPSVLVKDAIIGDRIYVCPGLVDYRFPLSEKRNLETLKPADLDAIWIGHNQIGVGEMLAWKKTSSVLSDSSFGDNSCLIIRL